MKKKTIAIVVAVWLACGVFNTGVVYADLQHPHGPDEFSIIAAMPREAEMTREADARLALAFGLLGLLGPLGTPYALPCFFDHGWQLPPPSAFDGT